MRTRLVEDREEISARVGVGVGAVTTVEAIQLNEDGEPLERLNSSPYSAAMLGWLFRRPGW